MLWFFLHHLFYCNIFSLYFSLFLYTIFCMHPIPFSLFCIHCSHQDYIISFRIAEIRKNRETLLILSFSLYISLHLFIHTFKHLFSKIFPFPNYSWKTILNSWFYLLFLLKYHLFFHLIHGSLHQYMPRNNLFFIRSSIPPKKPFNLHPHPRNRSQFFPFFCFL